ncbi:unnamed protein product [Lathyrus sativus]|nr:unnamed protein product [Lathyrus sativus]
MKQKVDADRMSQPSRAILMFCKVNGIVFQKIHIYRTFQTSASISRISRYKLFERYFNCSLSFIDLLL